LAVQSGRWVAVREHENGMIIHSMYKKLKLLVLKWERKSTITRSQCHHCTNSMCEKREKKVAGVVGEWIVVIYIYSYIVVECC